MPASEYLSVLFNLLLVLSLLGGMFWLLRRLKRLRQPKLVSIELQHVSHLGNREKLILVRVKEKDILLGVTPQQITALHVFDSAAEQEINEAVIPFSMLGEREKA